MKLILTLFLLSLMVKDPYYMIDATAYPTAYGTQYIREDGHIFTDGRHYSGAVVLVMDSNNTEDVTDDTIWQVVRK